MCLNNKLYNLVYYCGIKVSYISVNNRFVAILFEII